MSSILRFIIVCLGLTAVLVFASEKFHEAYFGTKPGGFVYFLFAWFVGISILNFIILEKAITTKPKAFVNTYYITVMIRMLASTLILVAYILTAKVKPKPVIIVFAVQYFAYFILELIYLAKMVKQKNQVN